VATDSSTAVRVRSWTFHEESFGCAHAFAWGRTDRQRCRITGSLCDCWCWRAGQFRVLVWKDQLTAWHPLDTELGVFRQFVYCTTYFTGHYMYHTVVTIRTASLTFTNPTFCPHSVFMCFVWIWEQTAIISLYSINWLVCITETDSVYCAVRTGYLNTIQVPFSLCSSHWPFLRSPKASPKAIPTRDKQSHELAIETARTYSVFNRWWRERCVWRR
jgi:hypothetical protein